MYSEVRAPAPLKDQIKGSDKNPSGSASGTDNKIKLDAKTELGLQNKTDNHNLLMKQDGRPSWTRVRVGALRAVYRRGAGAFSSSHRPNVTRGQWAMARVNAFLVLADKGKPKNPKYVGDNDLLNSSHPRYAAKRYDDQQTEMRAEVDLSPPQFMRDNAERGLRYHAEGLSGDGLMPQTVEDARKMVNGIVTEAKWRKIAPWIARHLVDLDAVKGDEITAGVVAHLLWGSGSTKEGAMRAMEHAQGIIDKLDEERSLDDELETDMEYDDDEQTVISSDDGVLVVPSAWVTKSSADRSISYNTTELRASADGKTLVGYASVFDSPSEPLPYTEYVRRGAFRKTIKDGSDVRLLIDHQGIPLARTKSGTLMLSEDEIGLRVEAQLDETNPDAMRVISAMRRGDLSQMSFAFKTVKDSWNADRSIRDLKEVRLFDVSVVTYPAYEETVAELRSANNTDETTIASTAPMALRKRQIQLMQIQAEN